jgi:putative ABC transport system permease protein
LLGYAGQSFLSALAEEKLGFSLGPPSLWPLLTGILVGLITALGFGLAPLLKLPTVSVLGILRGEEGVAPPSMWLTIGLAVFTSGGLIFWQADEAVLTLWVMGLTVCLVVGLTCGGWVILWLATQIPVSRPTTRYVMSTVGGRRGMGVMQVLAFGLGITALLMVTVMRTQLMEGWMNSLPSDTPNRFLINIQPDQRTSLMKFFAEENLTTSGLYSMTRGRWVRHNGKPVEPQSFPTLQAQRFAAREVNLSPSGDLPHTNRIVSGTWWTAGQDDEHLLSLEREFAQTLGVGIGDEMTFRVAGVDLTGRVSNLREVAWDSFEVNFFVITTPGLLLDRPRTLITSFFLPAENTDTTIRLIQQFPSVTLFDIDSLMQQVRQVIQQVSVAVQYVFIFTLLAGIAVLTAAVQASAIERSRDAAVLRALGASTRRLWLTQFFEFALLGAVAGLLASTSAVATASILATEVFGFTLSPGWWVWGLGCIGGALGIGVAGTIALRPVVSRAPLKSLISD